MEFELKTTVEVAQTLAGRVKKLRLQKKNGNVRLWLKDPEFPRVPCVGLNKQTKFRLKIS